MFIALVLLSIGLQDARPQLWGDLRPGAYGVGYKVLAGESAPGAAGWKPRPIEVAVWYPTASHSRDPRITFGDYFASGPGLLRRSVADEADRSDLRKALSGAISGAFQKVRALAQADPARAAVIAWSYAGESAWRIAQGDARIHVVIGLDTNVRSNWIYQSQEAMAAIDAVTGSARIGARSRFSSGDRRFRPTESSSWRCGVRKRSARSSTSRLVNTTRPRQTR